MGLNEREQNMFDAAKRQGEPKDTATHKASAGVYQNNWLTFFLFLSFWPIVECTFKTDLHSEWAGYVVGGFLCLIVFGFLHAVDELLVKAKLRRAWHVLIALFLFLMWAFLTAQVTRHDPPIMRWIM